MAVKLISLQTRVENLPAVDVGGDAGWVEQAYDSPIEAIIAKGFVLQWARTKTSFGQAHLIRQPGQIETILKFRKVKRGKKYHDQKTNSATN